MTNGEAVNWLRNIAYDTGKAEHSDLWHYQQALFEIIEMLEGQPDLDEWCTDCKEYDSKRHCCPRFNRVIREVVEETKEERKTGHWMDMSEGFSPYKCSECGAVEFKKSNYCPNCGAKMEGEES